MYGRDALKRCDAELAQMRTLQKHAKHGSNCQTWSMYSTNDRPLPCNCGLVEAPDILTSDVLLRHVAERCWILCSNDSIPGKIRNGNDYMDCPECKGTGKLWLWKQPCKGWGDGCIAGRRNTEPCLCGGLGWVPGVRDGDTVRAVHLEDVFLAATALGLQTSMALDGDFKTYGCVIWEQGSYPKRVGNGQAEQPLEAALRALARALEAREEAKG